MLPKAGGILDQDESDILRIMAIYDHLEEWRDIEMKKASSQADQPQPDRPRG